MTDVEMTRWMRAVVAFAAPHVAAGLSLDEAIDRGAADYEAFLERLALGATHLGCEYESDAARLFRACKERLAGDIRDAINAR